MAMWREDELLPIRIAEDVRSGLFFLAECCAKAFCRRKGVIGSTRLGHRAYPRTRPALSPLGLRSIAYPTKSGL